MILQIRKQKKLYSSDEYEGYTILQKKTVLIGTDLSRHHHFII